MPLPTESRVGTAAWHARVALIDVASNVVADGRNVMNSAQDRQSYRFACLAEHASASIFIITCRKYVRNLGIGLEMSKQLVYWLLPYPIMDSGGRVGLFD